MAHHRLSLHPPALWHGAGAALREIAARWRGTAPAVPADARTAASSGQPKVALALQGGGAHGAFTWGVVDAMLENGVAFEAVSGTSAGAFNAVFLAQGWLDGGPQGAREALSTLWSRIGAKAAFSPLRANLFDQLANGWNMDNSSSHVGFDLFSRVLSPYQFNPLDMNPLRDLLRDHIDFGRIRRNRRIRLFIAATDVESGRLRIFRTREITEDVILASATLPWLHQAVEIEGRHYWDGGFTANPPLMPLVSECGARDLVLVRLDSGAAESVPVSARAIQARLNRILFTGPLNHDLDELSDLQALARSGQLRGTLARNLLDMRLHVIDGGDALEPFGQSSKMNAHRSFLRELHGLGREHGAAWILAPSGDRLVTLGDDYVGEIAGDGGSRAS